MSRPSQFALVESSALAAAETGSNQNHLMIHLRSTAALAAGPVAIEMDPNLIRPTAASNHRPAVEAAPESLVAAHRLWPVIPESASCRPEYKRPASLPQKCGYRLGSVSSDERPLNFDLRALTSSRWLQQNTMCIYR